VTAVEGGGSCHVRFYNVHASVHVGYTPTSKIYSQVRVGHAPARGGRIGNQLAAKWSGGSSDHSGESRVVVKLLEVNRFFLSNPKTLRR
jgi:hypothetical protein